MRSLKIVLLIAILPSPLSAQNRALIEQALDEPSQITLDNVRLADAINKVSEQTGVRIVMPDSVMRLTPHGPDTVIKKVDIARVPLREGLNRLFGPMGMSLVVDDNGVEIVPKSAILCLGRAPTWNELETLSELSAMQPGLDAAALSKLQSRVQFQSPMPDGWKALSEAIGHVGAGAGDDVLTLACTALGWGWCLSDRHVVVAPLEVQIQERLRLPVSLRLNERPLFEVMTAIGEQIGVRIYAEPGAIASLPPQMQKSFSIHVHNRPVEFLLNSITAHTGLGYLISPDGVMFYRGSESVMKTSFSSQGGGTAPGSSADPYVAKIVMPFADGRSFEWLIRRSELPEDIKKLREDELAKFIELVRQRSQKAGS